MNVAISKPLRRVRVKPAGILAVGGDNRRLSIQCEVSAPNPGDEELRLTLEFDIDDRDWIPRMIAGLQALQAGATSTEYTVRADADRIRPFAESTGAKLVAVTGKGTQPMGVFVNPFGGLK